MTRKVYLYFCVFFSINCHFFKKNCPKEVFNTAAVQKSKQISLYIFQKCDFKKKKITFFKNVISRKKCPIFLTWRSKWSSEVDTCFWKFVPMWWPEPPFVEVIGKEVLSGMSSALLSSELPLAWCMWVVPEFDPALACNFTKKKV